MNFIWGETEINGMNIFIIVRKLYIRKAQLSQMTCHLSGQILHRILLYNHVGRLNLNLEGPHHTVSKVS